MIKIQTVTFVSNFVRKLSDFVDKHLEFLIDEVIHEQIT